MKQRLLPYEPALDGLRGVAILAVMIFHALPTALPGGFLGVDIFFALSGYLITRLLLLEYISTNNINLAKFYTRRWWRLAPALLFMLLIYGIFVFTYKKNSAFNNEGVDIIFALVYLTNWARAFQLTESNDLGHTWSLAIEEQFYIFWPLLLIILIKMTGHRVMLLASIITLAILSFSIRKWLIHDDASIARIYNGLDTRAETLMWGAGLATIMEMEKEKITRIANLDLSLKITATLPFIFGILFFSTVWNGKWYSNTGITFLALLSITLIFLIHTQTKGYIKYILSYRWLVWIGTISYGLYIWHFPIYRLLEYLDINGGCLLLIGSLMTFIVATLSFYFIEQPLIASSKRTF